MSLFICVLIKSSVSLVKLSEPHLKLHPLLLFTLLLVLYVFIFRKSIMKSYEAMYIVLTP